MRNKNKVAELLADMQEILDEFEEYRNDFEYAAYKTGGANKLAKAKKLTESVWDELTKTKARLLAKSLLAE